MTADSETVGFEWSEGGLAMLRAIYSLIDTNGGIIIYANKLEAEWRSDFKYVKREWNTRYRYYSQDELNFIISNSHLRAKKLALLLKNRSESSIRNIRHKLILEGKIKRKKVGTYFGKKIK